MAIQVNLDVMLARRKMTLSELASKVDITLANLSVLKTGRARAIRFSTLDRLCRALDCQPGDLLAYDENCKWDAYALTMPVTRRDLALSKYLLALVGAGAMALLSAVCALMMGATPDEVFSTIGLLLAAGLCMISIMLPLLFRFGVQKGRMVMIVVVLLPVALTVMFPEVFPVALPAGTGWLFLAALVLLACSALASVRVCEHKEY